MPVRVRPVLPNMRLVLISNSSKTYTVYENKQCIAVYELENNSPLPGEEEIEELRNIEVKDKA